jgi:predicted nucleic acid-binding protein
VIFVDTSAWFAAYVPNDAHHRPADAFLESTEERLLTTDFVLDELLTLLKARGEFQRAVVLGERLLRGSPARLEWVQPADVFQAWQVFQTHKDKAWSFTDCVSHVVMTRLGIIKAFAFDEHFRQFGSVVVFP